MVANAPNVASSAAIPRVKQLLVDHPRLYRLAQNALWAWRSGYSRMRHGPYTRRAVRDYLARHPIARLQLGCGMEPLPGWLNTDVWVHCSGVFFLDATRRFPIDDGVFHYVYSEHMIEHITVSDAKQMLSECRRVMKIGGKIRIATPSLAKVFAMWRGDAALADEYVRLALDRIPKDVDASPAYAVDLVMRGYGHKFIYDERALGDLLRSVGFGGIKVCEPKQSDDPVLRNLEPHAHVYPRPELYNLETMIVEAIRSE
jgi:predicted SAM-dependent methyltransferase